MNMLRICLFSTDRRKRAKTMTSRDALNLSQRTIMKIMIAEISTKSYILSGLAMKWFKKY